ncbi:DUF1778 domain-containing protein [Arcicella rosea]|uniref:Uncharacterized protein (DUF1778 family) n=1 Tax=Arcicella rosea TaxID=502909 RepID=A0A841ER80_9BACT|nr:DUF1778 domain-containing protein [Arcicella rosea]MBB6004794.1 uncharacterized protein (DUF1778 family) [Arcicella rosea]
MGTIINDRIDVRISKEQKEFVKYASEISGFKNLSEFIIYCINKQANEIILENNLILKSLEDKRVFVDAILNPPQPNSKLKRAQLNYKKFIEQNASSDSEIS